MAAVLTGDRHLSTGDIGLIWIRGIGIFGAIWTGRRWALKAKDPVICASFPMVAAWRVGSDAAALPPFLTALAAKPFRFGETDCAMAVADWVLLATGRDPAAELRGRYRTRIGWVRIANAAGGITPLFADLAKRSGLRRII